VARAAARAEAARAEWSAAKVKPLGTGYLEGLRCPECGECETLYITGLVQLTVVEDGSHDEDSDHHWDKDSDCVCSECNHSACVEDFRVEVDYEAAERVCKMLVAAYEAGAKGESVDWSSIDDAHALALSALGGSCHGGVQRNSEGEKIMGTTKTFDISDVLSITTERLVSSRHMDGVYDVLNFMTGENLFTHQLVRASKVCKPELLRQFPVLDSGEMQFAVGELILRLDSDVAKGYESELVVRWISKLTDPNGYLSAGGKQRIIVPRRLEVTPLQDGGYEAQDPMDELASMVGDKTKIIQVVTDPPTTEGDQT